MAPCCRDNSAPELHAIRPESLPLPADYRGRMDFTGAVRSSLASGLTLGPSGLALDTERSGRICQGPRLRSSLSNAYRR